MAATEAVPGGEDVYHDSMLLGPFRVFFGSFGSFLGVFFGGGMHKFMFDLIFLGFVNFSSCSSS